MGEKREVLFAATIEEEAGSFQRFCQVLADRSVTEFNYRYADSGSAQVFVGIQTQGGSSERGVLFNSLEQAGYALVDFTDNEMAITHIRYMVGGHANAENEVIYRFEFPERPGALLSFLKKVKTEWNISLFHYRNHGADYGRVLIGLQVEDIKELESKFDELGYYYKNETDYEMFLS